MIRDHRKLDVFQLADALVIDVYRCTAGFPIAERFGLQSQIRRAALSVAANIVEGCARRSGLEYCRFLEIAFASARETDALLHVAVRLQLVDPETWSKLTDRYGAVQGKLANLIKARERDP